MRKLLLPILVTGLVYGYQQYQPNENAGANFGVSERGVTPEQAIWRSGNQVHSSGTVSRILSDDNEGSRHQRFIVQLSSGRTLLVAHNVDLAPRVQSLSVGDTVSFYGEYESNDRGGVIHWTHHDPRGRHPGGWIEHKGRRYE